MSGWVISSFKFFSRLSKFGRVVFIKLNWLRIVIVKQGSLPFKKPKSKVQESHSFNFG